MCIFVDGDPDARDTRAMVRSYRHALRTCDALTRDNLSWKLQCSKTWWDALRAVRWALRHVPHLDRVDTTMRLADVRVVHLFHGREHRYHSGMVPHGFCVDLDPDTRPHFVGEADDALALFDRGQLDGVNFVYPPVFELSNSLVKGWAMKLRDGAHLTIVSCGKRVSKADMLASPDPVKEFWW